MIKREVYFCDYTKEALDFMKNNGITNDDIQDIFNFGFSESQVSKFIDKNGYRIKIHYNYDAYTLRYVILAVYKRPLKPF